MENEALLNTPAVQRAKAQFARRHQMLAMRRAGQKVKDIAGEFQVTKGAVSQAIQKAAQEIQPETPATPN